MSSRVRKDCRLCNSHRLVTVLELTATPPANEFVHGNDQLQETFPLYLAECQACGHVQLPVVVDPERLFRNYVYVSGTSPAFVQHFRLYAEACVSTYNLQPGDLVVDIGSNDGTLLKQFQQLGMTVCGIDPAVEIAKRATADGVPTYPVFFTQATARLVKSSNGKPAALVVANNVFAHADDLKEIALGVRELLDPKRGRFVFEVQYLVDLVEKTLFDMVYHEHLSYHSLGPLVSFFDSLDMTLTDAEWVPTHGGSVRCVAVPTAGAERSQRLERLLERELARLVHVDPFPRLAKSIDALRWQFRQCLDSCSGKVVGFGAPAKLTTLAHHLGIQHGEIAYVVDDSEWKQGLYTPGLRIPVVPPSRITEEPPDRVVIFAWNFAEQIAAKHPELKGKFVVPLPAFREV